MNFGQARKPDVWASHDSDIQPSQLTKPVSSVSSPVHTGIVADDLSREVHGLLGIPIDAIDMEGVLTKIRAAASKSIPFFLSTPNLDFLRITGGDRAFRESLLCSDLCPVDGFPLVWLARLIGIPINERVAGSDIFSALKSVRHRSRPLAVFLFGGADGIASVAANNLNDSQGGIICVGSLGPGFGSIDELSSDDIISSINASNADFLIASLGAEKGQGWLLQNRHRLKIPVKSHLGATLNFEAGTLKRAPALLRRWGLEWLWRIKEEPHLWRRYWKDFSFLTRLMLFRVLPLALLTRRRSHRRSYAEIGLELKHSEDEQAFHLHLVGSATAANAEKAIDRFREALRYGRDVVIHLSDCYHIDTRFFGLLLMLRKQLVERSLTLKLIGAPSQLEWIFRLNGFDFLLSPEH